MNHNTQKALAALTPESTELVIRDDRTLSRRDVAQIARIIARHHFLDKVEISACEMGYGKAKRLVAAMQRHPSITKVDFSRNQLSDPISQVHVIRKLVQNSPRLHSVELSDQLGGRRDETRIIKGGMIVGGVALGAGLLSGEPLVLGPFLMLAGVLVGAVFGFEAGDRIPSLNQISVKNPSLVKVNSVLQLDSEEPEHSPHLKNLLNLDRGLHNNNIVRNNTLATLLLKKVIDAAGFSFDDVQQINRRLPAVLVIAEESGKRAEVIKKLVEANASLPPEYGITFDIDRFITRNDARAAGIDLTPAPSERKLFRLFQKKPVSLSAEIVPALAGPSQVRLPTELPTIREAVAALPALPDVPTLRKGLEATRHDPAALLDYGRDAITAVGSIAMASLQSSTWTTPLERPVRSMAAFLDEFTRAKELVAAFATTREPKAFKRALSALTGRDSTADDLRNLAEAGSKARRSGQILQSILPVLDAMDGDLAQQLTTTRQIMDAYRLVSQHVCNLRQAGEETRQSWEKESVRDLNVTSTSVALSAQEKPYDVNVLTSRLEVLSEIDTQIKGHIASHTMQGAVDQKQHEGVALLRNGNIPLLAERVAMFQKQVGALQRAGLISGVADATKAATERSHQTSMLAAMATVQSIEKLVDTTQQALLDLGRSVETSSLPAIAANRNGDLRSQSKPGQGSSLGLG